jgi:preprotein translocase subunit SecG
MMYVLATLIEIAILLLGIFMILLILIQRGKGGGLAGAFGGVGGSSAFGSRAGDAFTRLTIYVATIWILLIMIEIRLVQPNINAAPPAPPITVDGRPGPAKPVDGELEDEQPAPAKDKKDEKPEPPKDQPVPVKDKDKDKPAK